MAKKTKDSNLSLEERLEQALIPNWDEPYKLPPNWCWIKLSALSSIISKGTTPTGGKSAYVNEGVHFLRIENINDDGTISHDNIACVTEEMHTGFLKRSILQERDVLVSIAGTLGKTGLVRDIDLPLNTNQAIAFVRLNSETINESYIKSAIDSPVMQKFLLGKTKVTSIPNLTLEIIGDCPIPLAPFNEQQRIVACIESFFAKLDEAKEKAQEVVDGFETRKAAILHKAFSGELTAKWREENGEKYSDWKFSMLGNHLYPMRTQKPSGEVFRYIDIDSIDNINQCVREPKIISVKEAPSRASRAVKIGSVLFSMVRPYLKNIALISEDLTDCIASTGFYVCDCKTDLLPQYLYELLRSDDAINYLMQFMKGDNSPSIRKDDLLEMVIAMPSILEQMEIVRILKELISKEQQAKDSAASVIEQIDTMKKAILARAFRGELGTNDPSEESAIVLVKSILSRDTKSTADRSNSNTHYLSTQKSNQTRYRVKGSGFGRTRSSIVGSKGMAMSKQTIGKALFAIQGVHQWKPNTNAHVVAGVRPIKTPVKKQIVSRGKTVHEREILKVLCESVETPVHIGKLITVGSKWTDKMDAIRSLEKSGVIVRISKDKFKIK